LTIIWVKVLVVMWKKRELKGFNLRF
jgi:hypothetical protein